MMTEKRKEIHEADIRTSTCIEKGTEIVSASASHMNMNKGQLRNHFLHR